MTQLLLPYPLVVRVPCRTSRTPGTRARYHPVTIETDGSITTPHDLETERVASALGGYLSCVDLVDHAGPAFVRWLGLHLRTDGPAITTTDSGVSWRSRDVARCCWQSKGSVSPEAAAAHAREPAHVANLHGADVHQLRALIKGAAIPEPPLPDDPLIRRLWECGLSPGRIAQIRSALPPGSTATAEFCLAVSVRGLDLDWVATTLRDARVEPELAMSMALWLAWTADERDREQPGLRALWLRLGATRADVLSLTSARCDPVQVQRLAHAWGISGTAAAATMAGWFEHRHRLSAEDLDPGRFPGRALPPRSPGTAMVTRLRCALGACSRQSTDTELALLLARYGTVAHTVQALHRAGYTSYRPHQQEGA